MSKIYLQVERDKVQKYFTFGVRKKQKELHLFFFFSRKKHRRNTPEEDETGYANTSGHKQLAGRIEEKGKGRDDTVLSASV